MGMSVAGFRKGEVRGGVRYMGVRGAGLNMIHRGYKYMALEMSYSLAVLYNEGADYVMQTQGMGFRNDIC